MNSETLVDDIIDHRQFNKTIYSQSPFYSDFKTILDEVEDSSEKTGNNLNNLYNPEFLEKCMKKYMTYLPLFSIVVHNKRLSNSHVENYFATIQRRCRRKLILGKLPTKCLRFLKEVRERNISIYNRIPYQIPKTDKSHVTRKVQPIEQLDLNHCMSGKDTLIKNKRLRKLTFL